MKYRQWLGVIIGSSILLNAWMPAFSNPLSSTQSPGISVNCQIRQLEQYPDPNVGKGLSLLNPYMPVGPFDRLIDSYLQQRKYSLAWQVAQRSNSMAVEVATLQRIATQLEDSNQTTDLKALVGQIAVRVPHVAESDQGMLAFKLWMDLGHRRLRLKNRELAIAAFTEAAQVAQSLQSTPDQTSFTPTSPQALLLQEVATALISADQPERAKPLLDQSLALIHSRFRARYRIALLLDLSLDYRRIGQTALANELMQRSLNDIQSLPPRNNRDVDFSQLDAYEQVLDRLVAAGQTQKALQITDQMLAKAKPDSRTSTALSENGALRVAIESLLTMGRLERGLELARRIPNPELQLAVFQSIALHYHRQNQPQVALGLMAENEKRLLAFQRTARPSYTLDLVGGYLEMNQVERAIALTETSLARETIEPALYEPVLVKVITHLIAAHRPEQASSFLRLHGKQMAGYYQLEIALAYLNIGQLDTAFQLIQAIQDDASRNEGLRQIAIAYAELGRYGDADPIAKQLSTQIPENTQLLQLLSCARQKP